MFRTLTGDAEARPVAELLGVVFDDSEINHWLVDGPAAERLDRMTAWFEILVRHALTGAGQVVVADSIDSSYAAAAVWFDRTGEATEPENYAERTAEAAGPHLARFQALDEVFDEHHPAEPHQHLAFLVAQPQRTGLGSKLLQHTTSRLTVPVYLEATSVDSRRLYETRHGFDRMDPPDIRPAGDGPAFHRMWRKAA
ncbi:N-acetyltransferase [Actinoplanes sp. RD1]|uniref:N-acetyltransferase n=1 Tax=Actinoplanes sp. RD1 TaxID=3064538 RepID=UPI0027420DA2|nr:N-acetyltransferase [Actinoplanes sp. RD1]